MHTEQEKTWGRASWVREAEIIKVAVKKARSGRHESSSVLKGRTTQQFGSERGSKKEGKRAAITAWKTIHKSLSA